MQLCRSARQWNIAFVTCSSGAAIVTTRMSNASLFNGSYISEFKCIKAGFVNQHKMVRYALLCIWTCEYESCLGYTC